MDNKDPLSSQVVALCPSCGLYTADMHGSQEDCIRALEAEVRKLSSILDRSKKRQTTCRALAATSSAPGAFLVRAC